MSSPGYHRQNDRSSRRVTQHSSTRSVRLPSSSHSHQRPSPGLPAAATATPLWGPALWDTLRAAGKEDRRTPTSRVGSRTARPAFPPPRSRPPRGFRHKRLTCLDEDSESSSEEEFGRGTVGKSQARQSSTSNRYQRIIRSESEADDDMLSTARLETPLVSKATTSSKPKKSSTDEKAKNVGSAIVPCKRRPPQHREEDEHASKIQKTDQMGSNATALKHHSSQTPIVLNDSDDDTPLAEIWSPSRAPPVVVKEDAPSALKGFFSGLGVGRLGSSWSFPRTNSDANASSINVHEDVDLPPSPTSPGERSTRSASRNFDLYQKSVADFNRSTTQIAELEHELENCKRDCETRIETLKGESEAALMRLRHSHSTALEQLQREVESGERLHKAQVESVRQEGEATLKNQAEAQRLNLLDIQRTATRQDDEKTQRIAALEADNRSLSAEKQSLKGQLHAERADHSQLRNSLEQREILVPTEESLTILEVKNISLEERNLVLTRELQALKQRHPDTLPHSQFLSQSQSQSRSERPFSPAPTLSNHPSDETKTTNVRSMFLKVKRKHDNFITAAKRIREVTNGMDLAAFGEFGKRIGELTKVLKDALEEDGAGGRSGGSGARQEGSGVVEET